MTFLKPTVLGFLMTMLVLPSVLQGQVHCGSVTFEPNSPITLNLKFDSFEEYVSGITIYGIGQLRIKVEDKAIPDPDCKWFLRMEVNNNPGSGTAVSDWETLLSYGTSGPTPPTLDILEVRISNNCATSPIDGAFGSYFTNHGDVQDIIADLIPRTNAGSCIANVNGPGSYLTNYNEYTFQIDVRVRPGLTFTPGVYQLNLVFHLEEQM